MPESFQINNYLKHMNHMCESSICTVISFSDKLRFKKLKILFVFIANYIASECWYELCRVEISWGYADAPRLTRAFHLCMPRYFIVHCHWVIQTRLLIGLCCLWKNIKTNCPCKISNVHVSYISKKVCQSSKISYRGQWHKLVQPPKQL